MTKSAKKTQPDALRTALLSTLPWNCTSFGESSEIEAYVAGREVWETIAEVRPCFGFDGEEIAGYIVGAVNSHEKTQEKLRTARMVIELCLQCEALPQKTRQKADEGLRALAAPGDPSAA